MSASWANASPGGSVKERRRSAELTQEQLARRARCSTSSVKLVERGWQASPALTARIDRALQRALQQKGVPGDEQVSNPWGHKFTVSAYFTGEPDEDGIRWAIEKLNEIWPDAAFIGMSVDDVQDEPRDQVAT